MRLRRGNARLDAALTMDLKRDDVVAVAGRSGSLLGRSASIGWQEADDRELTAVAPPSLPTWCSTDRYAGRPVPSCHLASQVGARGVFLSSLRRGGRELPFARSHRHRAWRRPERVRHRAEVARVASHVGFVEYPTAATDLGLVGATIFIGGVLGLLSSFGGTAISLTTSRYGM